MGRLLGRVVVSLLVVAALLYLGDFLVWKIRSARGGGMDTVSVTRTVVAPLKGNREEYTRPGRSRSAAASRSSNRQAMGHAGP